MNVAKARARGDRGQPAPVKAAVWALVASVLQRAVGVIATPAFTRMLSASQYAQYALYQSWHEILLIFASWKLFDYCSLTMLSRAEGDRDGYLASAQALTILLTLGCLAICLSARALVGELLGFPPEIVMLMFADMLGFSSFNLWAAGQRSAYRYRALTVLTLLTGVLGPLMGIFATRWAGEPGYGRIYGAAAANIAAGLWAMARNLRRADWRCLARYWRRIRRFCLPLIPHFLSTQILSRFDRVMIDRMAGAAQAGMYSLGYSVSMLGLIVNEALMRSLVPWTYRSIREGGDSRRLRTLANLSALLVACGNLALILLAPEAVALFAPAEYREAVYVVPAVSAGVYYMYLFNLFVNIEYYYAETRFVACASVAAAALNLLLNWLCIPRFGYAAAGYTTLASYMLYAAGHWCFMRAVARRRAEGRAFYDGRALGRISAAFTAMALLAVPGYDCGWLRLALALVSVAALARNRRRIASALAALRKDDGEIMGGETHG